MPSKALRAALENQRKRERRRRNRQVLYKELEDLVLRHTQVRVRPDGGVLQENDRIGFRISPNLEQHERYSYLLNRLTPKPRKTSTGGAEHKNKTVEQPLPSQPRQDGEQMETLRQDDEQMEIAMTSSSPQKQKAPRTPTPEREKAPTETAMPMEGVEESHPIPSSTPEAEPGTTSNVNPGQGMTTSSQPSLVLPSGLEQEEEAIPQLKAVEDEDMTKKNLALCGTLAVCPRLETNDGWQPPRVTHEFGYPSDEEIVPNPKANFKKNFLPRLGHVRSWFKSTDIESTSSASTTNGGARSSASCLPITAAKGALSDGDMAYHSDISPRRYTDITSRLPQDPDELFQVASRPGANTRLRSIARQSMTDGSTDEEELDEDKNSEESFSDASSSSSLEKLPNSPPYEELAPSVLSDYEGDVEDIHTAPAHMTVDVVAGKAAAAASAEASARAAGEASLEEQVKEQRESINQLATKLDRFIELMTSNKETPPQDELPRVTDPQEEELQAGALARVLHEDNRQESSTDARQ